MRNQRLMEPAIYIMPRWLFLVFLELNGGTPSIIAQRIADLESAVARYRQSTFTPKQDWIDELKELNNA
jgi:hypothetical protein